MDSVRAFNPREYDKHVATRKALNRADNKEVDIDIHYVDINPDGAKRTLLFVHGWPGLWSTWARQIDAFKDEYRILAVDLRGFGASTHPGDVRASGNMVDMTGNLVAVLANAKVDKAVVIGHDWGSPVAYEAARARPDLFEAVVGVAVPYLPANGPFCPTAALAAQFESLNYQIYFSTDPAVAAAELDADIRRTLRIVMRGVSSKPPSPAGMLHSKTDFLGVWKDLEPGPISFLSPDEEDYIVEQYAIQGFKNTIQFYQHENKLASWKFAHDQGNFTITQPVFAVYPTKDKVADWNVLAEHLGTHKLLPRVTVLPIDAAHWPQLETPTVLNDALRAWLEGLDAEEQSMGVGSVRVVSYVENGV